MVAPYIVAVFGILFSASCALTLIRTFSRFDSAEPEKPAEKALTV